jgi:hypothetical protein
VSRLLWPNLDAELSWALESRGRTSVPRGFRRSGDPGPLLLRSLLFGLLGRPGDRLRLPVRGLQEKIRLGPALRARDLVLVEGPEVRLRRDETLLPWAWTESLLEMAGASGADSPGAVKGTERRSLRGGNDRFRWAPLDRARHLGLAASEAELSALLAALGPREAWVVKARWAAAGRQRLRGSGPVLAAEERRHLRRLLELSGGLVLERWDTELEERGLSLQVEEESIAILGAHDLEGRAGPRALRSHPESLPAEMVAAARACAETLRGEGYRGPLGLDFRRRGVDCDWEIGDVNVRHCFGHLLHAGNFEALSFGPPREEGAWEEVVALVGSPEESLFARRPPE